MGRREVEARERAARQLGRSLGEAFGSGLRDAIERALEKLHQELSPVTAALFKLREREAPADEASVSEIVPPMLRDCAAPGCSAHPVARGLCRKHYARQIYQERKERQGLEPPRPRRAATTSAVGDAVEEKKPVVPVAPIIRRKRVTAAAAAANATASELPQTDGAPTPTTAPEITPESVARWLGLGK